MRTYITLADTGAARVATRRGSGAVTWLMSDHLGSTSVIYDGTTALHQGYMPWGQTRFGDLGIRYQFTGQARDGYINLYWFGSRWYDGALGRWTQPDPIIPLDTQGVQAWDRYAFVNNNPVRFIDPNGYRLVDGRDVGEIDECRNGYCSSADDPFTRRELEDAIRYETGIDIDLIKNLGTEDLQQAYNNPLEFLITKIEEYTGQTARPFLAWKWTPLLMAAIQLLTADGLALLIASIPAASTAAIVGSVLVFSINRLSSVFGIAATGYQYQNNLYGTQKFDVWMSIGTSVFGTPPNFNITAAYVNFFYTLYRSVGGSLPASLPGTGGL